MAYVQGYAQPMWPPGYYTGSPFSGSPVSDYGPMQQYQQQQAMQGISRHQQVLLLVVGGKAAEMQELVHSQKMSYHCSHNNTIHGQYTH